MKRIYKILLISFVTLLISCQENNKDQRFNFGFEQAENGKPFGWSFYQSEGYITYLDSLNAHNGKYSVAMELKEGSPVGSSIIRMTLPDNYEGEQITLSAYIKTENVTEGAAGLAISIEPEISYKGMNAQGVSGTIGWKKYNITLPLEPSLTKKIILSAGLAGNGKAWIDDIRVTIDNKDITDAKIYTKEPLPAEKDKEFDGGSLITFPSVNESLVDDLELLGRLWGFLKYHHPVVAKGNFNWDYELFRMLPGYLATKSTEERDNILIAWIDKYGDVPVCTTCKKTSSDAFLKPDLSWADKMHTDLKNKIMNIYANRNQGEQYYIRINAGIGNPIFQNENAYSDMMLPDTGFRLLALYRYWNMIHYFFPYKHLTDKNWNDILKEYIPVFISADDELKYELAVLQLIGEIGDSHAFFISNRYEVEKLKGNNYPPFSIQFIEKKAIVTDYYNPALKESAGLEIGDEITHINGKTIEFLLDSLRKYYPASNEAARLRQISGDLLRSGSNSINIRFISSGQPKRMNLTLYFSRDINRNIGRWYEVIKSGKCYKMLDGNIGYVTLATIKNEDIPVIKETFKDAKGIIIDIRNYPSAFTPFTLAPYFVSKPTPFVKFTQGNVNNPGEFTFRDGQIIPKDNVTYQGKLVVIVNEFTQSSAEYQSMAFRAGDNTTIVGSATAGADGNISNISFPGGLRTNISGIGVYYPDGRETQRIGIIPDIIVEPTINGLKQGRDELLEKAIEVINNRQTQNF